MLKPAFNLSDLAVFLVDVLFMLAFQLDEFLFRLEDFLCLYLVSLDLCFLDDLFFPSVECQLADIYIRA